MNARITWFYLNWFIVYNAIACLIFIQVNKQFPIRAVTRGEGILYWHGHSGLVLVAWRYTFLLLALGGKRFCERGKDTAVFGWTVLYFFRVGVSSLAWQQGAAPSLVGEVVVFTRPGPAAVVGC